MKPAPISDWLDIIQNNGITLRFNNKQANVWEAFIWTPTQHSLSEQDDITCYAVGKTPLKALMKRIALLYNRDSQFEKDAK